MERLAHVVGIVVAAVMSNCGMICLAKQDGRICEYTQQSQMVVHDLDVALIARSRREPNLSQLRMVDVDE